MENPTVLTTTRGLTLSQSRRRVWLIVDEIEAGIQELRDRRERNGEGLWNTVRR